MPSLFEITGGVEAPHRLHQAFYRSVRRDALLRARLQVPPPAGDLDVGLILIHEPPVPGRMLKGAGDVGEQRGEPLPPPRSRHVIDIPDVLIACVDGLTVLFEVVVAVGQNDVGLPARRSDFADDRARVQRHELGDVVAVAADQSETARWMPVVSTGR